MLLHRVYMLTDVDMFSCDRSHVVWRHDSQMDEMPRDARPDEQTFLFADLAGFTALTEAHGDEHATDLVEEFSRAAGARLPDYGAQQVKAVGDALMLRVPVASAAVWLGCALTGELMADHGYPAIRVGMHHGS